MCSRCAPCSFSWARSCWGHSEIEAKDEAKLIKASSPSNNYNTGERNSPVFCFFEPRLRFNTLNQTTRAPARFFNRLALAAHIAVAPYRSDGQCAAAREPEENCLYFWAAIAGCNKRER